jgi:opacity protein-like surface antigen
MKKVTPSALRLSVAVVLSDSVNPLLIASAEEINDAPAAAASSITSSMPNSRTGWYVTVGAGNSWESAINYSRKSSVFSPRLGEDIQQERYGDVEKGDGAAAEAGVGFDFGNRLRGELTYLINTSTLGSKQYSGSISFPGGSDTFSGQADVSGRVDRNSVLASLYYDIPTKSRWVPYFGGGLGYTNVSASERVFNYNVALGSGGNSIGISKVPGGSGSALGYQAKIGLSYLASQSTDLFFEGNYFGNTSVDVGSGSKFGSFNGIGVKAGFRYRFGSSF